MVGSATQVLRRKQRPMGSPHTPEPRDWALRLEGPSAHWALPKALERDAWTRRRAALDEDCWADRRYTIDAPYDGPLVQGNPKRRQYILDSLDGGEAYYRFRPGRDIVREKVVPNNGPHRIGRKVDGRWMPVLVEDAQSK